MADATATAPKPRKPAGESPTNLQTKAVLVTLHVGGWHGKMKDAQASRKVTDDAGAKAKAAAVIKNLVDGAYLKPIAELAGAMRTVHYRLTMPWDDTGRRLLPVDVLPRYKREMGALFDKRDTARQIFVDGFEDARKDAERDLGTLYDATDYPTPERLKGRIFHDYRIDPVPDSKHFIADVGEAEAARIRKDIERATQGRITAAVQSLWARLGEALERVSTRLEPTAEDDKARTIRGNMIDSLRSLIDTIKALNVTGDRSLNSACAKVEKAIAGIQVDMLRENSKAFDPKARDRVKATMDDLRSKYAGYFGAGPAADSASESA